MTTGDGRAGMTIWVMAKGYAPDEGGMQTYARKVAETYAAQGAQVTVFTQSSAGPRRAELNGVAIVDVGPGSGPALPARLWGAMRAMLRSGGRPDFVHATTWRTAILPWLTGLSYVVTVHGREIMYARGAALWAMRAALRSADRIVAVSHYTRIRLIERLPGDSDKIVVAWNGLSALPRDRGATAAQPPLILTLCRLEARKNVAEAIEAAALCAGDGLAFRYAICGRGPELAALTALVAQRGMGERIALHGFVSDQEARRLYDDASIFLHPQISQDEGRDFEGFGIAIGDAMALGLACIAGSAGGTAELLRHGDTGLVVDGRDRSAIADAIRTLLADPVRRAAIGDAGQAHALDHFSWRRHCDVALGITPGLAAA